MLDGSPVILRQIALKPADPLTADDMVRIDDPVEPLFIADMPADDDRRRPVDTAVISSHIFLTLPIFGMMAPIPITS